MRLEVSFVSFAPSPTESLLSSETRRRERVEKVESGSAQAMDICPMKGRGEGEGEGGEEGRGRRNERWKERDCETYQRSQSRGEFRMVVEIFQLPGSVLRRSRERGSVSRKDQGERESSRGRRKGGAREEEGRGSLLGRTLSTQRDMIG